MKIKRLLAVSLLAAVTCSVFISTGCSKVQELADKAEGAVSEIGNNIVNFEDNITGGLTEEARNLDASVKDFYAGVLSGEINETTAGHLVTAPLPGQKATSYERTETANALTILSAIEWQGMTSRYSSEVVSKLVFSEGSIKPASSASGTKLSLDTTLGELFA